MVFLTTVILFVHLMKVQTLDKEKEDQKNKAKDLEGQLQQVQQRCNGLQVQ